MATQREVILDILASANGPVDAKFLHTATQARGYNWTITQVLASAQVMAANKLIARGPQPKTFQSLKQFISDKVTEVIIEAAVDSIEQQTAREVQAQAFANAVQASTAQKSPASEALTQIAEKSGKKSRPAKTGQNRVKLEKAPEASGSGKLSVNEIRRFLQEARCEEKPADPREHSLLLTDKQTSDKANLLAALLDAKNFFDVKDVSFRVVKGANALSGADTQLIYLQPVWTRKNK